MAESTRIAVIGTGRVGSTLAYSLAASGMAEEVVLVDANRDIAEGEAMDIAHAVPFFRPVRIIPGDLSDVAGATVSVICAGVAQREGEARPALLRRNVDVLRDMVPEIVRVNPEGLILMTTNPVDALTWAALRLSGLPPTRVFGSGTVLDTVRLRSELARYFSVDARNVHAYVLGEHGDSEFVAWSAASLAGVQLPDYCRLSGIGYREQDLDDIASRVRNAAYEIIRRKGATNFAIAASLTRIIEAIVHNEASVLTVSTLVDGLHGIGGVCLSFPAIVDRSGIRRVLEIPLSEGETARLHNSARVLSDMVAHAGV